MDPETILRAEFMGCLCRELEHPRDSNPYLYHIARDVDQLQRMKVFADAWWRGWDRTDECPPKRVRSIGPSTPNAEAKT